MQQTRTVKPHSQIPSPSDSRQPVGQHRTANISARTLRLLSGSYHLSMSSLLLGMLLIMVLFAPLLATTPPEMIQPALRLQPPGLSMPFGTDNLGRDMFSRVLFGSRIALKMSLLTVILSAFPGIILGLFTGYLGGWCDQIISRLMDVWMSLPGLLLAIILLARLGPSLTTTIIALGIAGVPGFYRLTRNSTISLSQMPYIEAATTVGADNGRILLRYILPNLASPIIVLATMRMGTVLLAGAGLSFIGLGAQPPTPEWGTLLANGRNYLDIAWWLAVFPGLAITLSAMGFNLLGDGLRDVLFSSHA